MVQFLMSAMMVGEPLLPRMSVRTSLGSAPKG